MPQGSAQAPQPADSTEPSNESPRHRRVDSVWLVVLAPAALIGLAAFVGYIKGPWATLVIGTVATAVVTSLVVSHVLGRTRKWAAIVWISAGSMSVAGVGLLQLRGFPSTAPAPVTVSAAPSSATSPGNAGRRFNQNDIGQIRQFRGADLRGAQFIRLNLQGMDFSGANAVGASFEGSRLDRAIFRGADLGGAVFSHACLRNVVMRGADLVGAIAVDADLSGADLAAAETSTHWPTSGPGSTACD